MGNRKASAYRACQKARGNPRYDFVDDDFDMSDDLEFEDRPDVDEPTDDLTQ